ncbi:hypothetical protein [Ahrensia sp. 13_GOM-1096m]|uniref:hypothetical protein n=1 Tax=Ahrensia sp. 13_GOM-1096m TaxID=1380380 RepID=UPI000683E0DB|nr:hypothetical protein [Ahrensia sp. 13_GOM-1096m]
MEQTKRSILPSQAQGKKADSALTGGAIVLAALSASCYILPLGLSIVGLGGSWLTFLSPFVRCREIILLVVGISVAWSWLRLWRSPCGLRGNRSGLILTSIATLVFIGALTAPLWENVVARSLWEILRHQS